jgi:putative glutamine amidotransferase
VVVTGRHADGTVEAIRVTDRTFAVGVQWHPERTGEHAGLWRALVEAADARASAQTIGAHLP